MPAVPRSVARRLTVLESDHFPASVVWELTLPCDHACAHCGSRAGGARDDELTTDKALAVVDELAAMKIREVVLMGLLVAANTNINRVNAGVLEDHLGAIGGPAVMRPFMRVALATLTAIADVDDDTVVFTGDLEDVELAPFVRAPSFAITTVTTARRPPQETTVRADLNFAIAAEVR